VETDETVLQDIVDELEQITGVTESKAEKLADEYRNLTTLYWSTWHDRDFIQSEIQINPFFLYKQLSEADLYSNYHSQTDKIERPDRPTDYDKWKEGMDLDHYGHDKWK